jgi:hypothetical protein
MRIDNPIFSPGGLNTAQSSSFSTTSSFSQIARGTAGTYAIYSSYAQTNPTNDGWTLGGVAAYESVDAGVKVQNTNNMGQWGTMYASASGFDFTKDFRFEVSTYIGTYIDTGSTGDFVEYFVGANGDINLNTGTSVASGQLGIGLYLYPGSAPTFNQGINLVVNGTYYYQSNNTAGITDNWSKYILEVTKNQVTNQRIATITRYFGSQNYIMVGGIDVTTWNPGGGFVGVRSTTGAARTNAWVNYIKLEYK